MKDFYEILESDGDKLETTIGFFESQKLVDEWMKNKNCVDSPYIRVVKRQMFTHDDKVRELEDRKILSTLTPTQLAALKRNPKFLK